jgi:hypothetical protein
MFEAFYVGAQRPASHYLRERVLAVRRIKLTAVEQQAFVSPRQIPHRLPTRGPQAAQGARSPMLIDARMDRCNPLVPFAQSEDRHVLRVV